MDLLGKLLKKEDEKKASREWQVGKKSRKQLNTKVDKRLIEVLHRLSRDYNVQRDELAEHALEVGIYYLKKIAENEETAKRMRMHLMEAHVNCDVAGDSEAALRLGEDEGDISAILTNIEGLIESQDRMLQALERQDADLFAVYEKAHARNVLKFLYWVQERYKM